VTTLARRAEAEVFGPSEPTAADVEEFWRQVDEIVGGMGRRMSFWQRTRARLSLRSLLSGTRLAQLGRIRFASPRRSAEPTPPTEENND